MAFSITYAANRFPESVVIGMDLAFFITITQAAVNMRFIADGNNLLYLQTLGLVSDICLAMDTEVCSVYLADHDRRCYYLMATRGLKKPRGRTVTLALDEGIVGLVGRLAEPISASRHEVHLPVRYCSSSPCCSPAW